MTFLYYKFNEFQCRISNFDGILFTPRLYKIGEFLHSGKSHAQDARIDSTPSILTLSSILEWVMDEQMDHPPSNHFLAIDENSIFNGSGLSPMGGKMIRSVAAATSRTKSPLSDLNPTTVPPVSLPDLRPVS